MNISQIKQELNGLDSIKFKLPDGSYVPEHFHVTEVGSVTKIFIDCGGESRSENYVSLQLWEDNDYDHRLEPKKLLKIIELSEKLLPVMNEHLIKVEYQIPNSTIGTYDLDFKDGEFHLLNTKTDCLAKDKCGITENSCCDSSGCC